MARFAADADGALNEGKYILGSQKVHYYMMH